VSDDAFERMLQREEEIRRRLEAGQIDEDEAHVLRDLGGDGATDDPVRLRLTVDQVARIGDEGVDAAVLRAVLDFSPTTTVDDAIDLCATYCPELECIRSLQRAGVRALDRDDLAALWDAGVYAPAVGAVVRYGCDDPVRIAVMLSERVDDPRELLDALVDLGLTGLSEDDLERLADSGVSPRCLARMLAAAPELSIGTALDLCIEEVDPDVVARLHAEGVELDVDRLRDTSVSVSLLNLRFGRRQVLVGGGRQHIRHSGKVDGFYVGSLTINPGVEVELGATIIGDLHVEPGARVVIKGRVTGAIDNRGTVEDPTPVS
jgi:hypothetical protein